MTLLRLLPVCALALLSACSRGDGAAQAVPPLLTDKFASDHFLQFFNKQTSLGAGDYRLVVAPAAVGTGTYTLVATLDDGSNRSFSGAWTAAASPDPADADDPSQAVTLPLAGGLAATLNASAAACLYLVDGVGNLVARVGDGDASTPACDAGATLADLALPHSKTNDVSYARAYYATIDPSDDRDTLDKWKQANGFGTAGDVHVIFHDTKDLGYGRDMHFHDGGNEAAPRPGQYALYVDNYAVNNVPGESYGPLNLDAAIQGVSQYHIGTNAIEYGPVDYDGDGLPDDVNFDGVVNEQDYFPRFYNFSPDPPYQRRLMVDLDGKGEKAMPGPCIVCHGGRADVLMPSPVNVNPYSNFPRGGDTLAHLQPLDVGSFEYSDTPPWTRAEIEPGLKAINTAVYDSYAANDAQLYDTTGNASFAYGYAEWDSTFARQMLESWYGGAGLPGSFADTYVPDDWNPAVNATVPAGADALYRDVVSTSCRTCHLLRGIDYQSDIDFTAYDQDAFGNHKFLGYADRIEDLVYDRGVMPLATLTFRNFYETDALATELGNALPGFSHFAPDGSLLLPGRPIARAGPDFTSASPAAVSGAASLFATTYQWSITSMPVGAVASLDDPASVRPKLTASLDGTYTLELVVGDGATVSAPDSVTVTINSAATPVTFTADIKPLLASAGCTGCHYPGGGPPVFYADPVGTDPPLSQDRDVYETFRSLVNFEDPEYSRMLLKPTGNHHGGGQVITKGDANYNLLLQWVLEGAPK